MNSNTQDSFYFAYGSNMNPRRVRQRNMAFDTYCSGVLEDYRLAFNKRSVKFPGAASANVEKAAGCTVEGVLYRLPNPEEIEVMDAFEGFPVRYRRELLPVRYGERIATAWVYIANQEFVTHGLKPARWYLEHLLTGGPYLSHSYYKELTKTDCLPDTKVEPG